MPGHFPKGMSLAKKTAAANGRVQRVIIENVKPEVEDGGFPVKRIVGETVEVTADIFADGHDRLSAEVLYRPASQAEWVRVAMVPEVNDLWTASFPIASPEDHLYTVRAWPDAFQTWAHDLVKRRAAAQDLSLQFLIGAELVASAAGRARGRDAERLRQDAKSLKQWGDSDPDKAYRLAEDEELLVLMTRYADLQTASTYPRELSVWVDRELAHFGAWYEMFPRSCTDDPARHGTFQDCIARLEYVAGMGFDILYLPPIHPIGTIQRKGKNNSTEPAPDDVGSPWAIGSELGGHTSIHPELGTLEDFKQLLAALKRHGMELAMDIAFQCAPDHPYVKEHREWFQIRPDGSVQFAENPPKKYQDIYPLYFDNEHATELTKELTRVVLYWAEQGVRIFRVDNPHTKPFALWEYLIREVRRQYPDAIFLAEAFTRPKVMYRLAKLGFTQSYSYFAWRNSKWELTQYFTELTQTEAADFFRANLWPNTPDILNEYLQFGGRPAFMIRLCLAATLGSSYGIYGPAFELCENRPVRPGSEEYLDSEKYQIRIWELDRPDSLKDLITRVNLIRKANPALRNHRSLQFHQVDNEQIIAYSKMSEDGTNVLLMVVNLDPHYKQSGWIELPLDYFRLEEHQPYQVHDQITGERYFWQGSRNYVELDPQQIPVHIFRLYRHLKTEQDFDYFL